METQISDKKVEKVIEKEVNKRLDQKLAALALSSVTSFRQEFKKQTLAAITAAFAFLIALTWRTPIQKSVDNLVASLNLNSSLIYYEYLAAIIITMLGVIALIIISKWAASDKPVN